MNLITIVSLFLIQSAYGHIYAYGPGLMPKEIVMPARYFFIVSNFTEKTIMAQFKKDITVSIQGFTNKRLKCRIWTEVLDRKDASLIVRYRVYEKCSRLFINILYKNEHIKDSPFNIKGPIYEEHCNCPEVDREKWFTQFGCDSSYDQINKDLGQFDKVEMNNVTKKIVQKYYAPRTNAFCRYIIKNNQVYRICYGEIVGFHKFVDKLILSILRKVVLPDTDFIINLGDWPLVRKNHEKVPMFAWCGSDDTIGIVLPTYDITEATLEVMGRVSLDILSVQGNIRRYWEDREPRAFWRGRDSNKDRLRLTYISKQRPDILNASLTHMYFHTPNDQTTVRPVSFFHFFDYKYQVNVDGTVAAYRLPYLLAGGGLVFKQESIYYEHFYKQLRPWVHYVPVKNDLSDLVEHIEWARNNDEMAHRIAKNGKRYANNNLLPKDIICYHAVIFTEWSKKLVAEVEVAPNMTHVPQPEDKCECDPEPERLEL